ncbi:hypothetical protein DFR29_103125 [Tahibacter aquaticus]|uniref:Uncharacterized protein n=1 Tax=Tahibacter aquaticus TaxID=520092 RepID=A0A4R6Z4L4_9GAMM|nr:hypothetical protein [Tahibacter aquaticus]TDR46591.1 hypothetical protein DFR29_103125 [Tahibacter aquaticus]
MSARHLAAATLLMLPAAAFAAFSMDWYSINGGGGVSSAPGISLAGTIGQASPGYSNSTGYSLTAGFWVAAPLVSDVIFRDGLQGATP